MAQIALDPSLSDLLQPPRAPALKRQATDALAPEETQSKRINFGTNGLARLSEQTEQKDLVLTNSSTHETKDQETKETTTPVLNVVAAIDSRTPFVERAAKARASVIATLSRVSYTHTSHKPPLVQQMAHNLTIRGWIQDPLDFISLSEIADICDSLHQAHKLCLCWGSLDLGSSIGIAKGINLCFKFEDDPDRLRYAHAVAVSDGRVKSSLQRLFEGKTVETGAGSVEHIDRISMQPSNKPIEVDKLESDMLDSIAEGLLGLTGDVGIQIKTTRFIGSDMFHVTATGFGEIKLSHIVRMLQIYPRYMHVQDIVFAFSDPVAGRVGSITVITSRTPSVKLYNEAMKLRMEQEFEFE